jgi:hypothetical protein
MSKKCVKCGAPIEGFWAKIARLFGVKKSVISPDCCNKCDCSEVTPASEVEPPKVEMPVEPPKVEMPVEPPKVEMPVEPPKVEMPVEPPTVEMPKTESTSGQVMTEPAEDLMEKPADDLMKNE